MLIRYIKTEYGLCVSLCEELDHHAARKAIEELDRLATLYPAEPFYLDLKELTFMDSSGIAVAINLQRALQRNGRKLTIVRPSRHVMRIFHAAGLEKMITFREVQS